MELLMPRRRTNQGLDLESCLDILKKASSGVLALNHPDGYPYALPLSFVCHDQTLYFHCARSGKKLEAIEFNPKASFCVIDMDQPEEALFSTIYRSVIAYGTVEIVRDPRQIAQGLDLLAQSFFPQSSPQARTEEIERSVNAAWILKMPIEKISGKQAKELV